MNPTLALIENRRSTRVYHPTPLSAAEEAAITHAALRAPTAGGMVLYTIIDVRDQAIKDTLAVTCDDQPFIAKAPLVLVFVADFQKWTDLFDDGLSTDEVAFRRTPGVGDLMMACSDALIAAQNAVVAAGSLGIGSCYIGDILENGETVADLLGLPPHAMPAAMVCFGRPASPQEPIAHYGNRLVHTDRYHRLTADERAAAADELAALHAPHGIPDGVASYPHAVRARKYDTAYMQEMNRSVAWWLARWQQG